MIAAVYRSTGGSSVLRWKRCRRLSPGAGEVLVRVVVAGVNPTDWKSRAGADGWARVRLPGAGAGRGGRRRGGGRRASPRTRVGERVWVYFAAWRRQWGTAAQYCVVPAEQAVPLPAGASFELGASLGIPALTAYHCLRGRRADRGADVLVAGGAGAVGHAAIELGVWAGARVISTVSGPEKGAARRRGGRVGGGQLPRRRCRRADLGGRAGRCVPDRRAGARAEPLARSRGDRPARRDLDLRRGCGRGDRAGAGADDAEPDAALRARLHALAPRDCARRSTASRRRWRSAH